MSAGVTSALKARGGSGATIVAQDNVRVRLLAGTSREDVRRDALSQSLDAGQTEDLLDRMTAAGWLRPKVKKTAGRSRRRWQVNPRVFAPAKSAQSAGSQASALSALPATSKRRRRA